MKEKLFAFLQDKGKWSIAVPCTVLCGAGITYLPWVEVQLLLAGVWSFTMWRLFR